MRTSRDLSASTVHTCGNRTIKSLRILLFSLKTIPEKVRNFLNFKIFCGFWNPENHAFWMVGGNTYVELCSSNVCWFVCCTRKSVAFCRNFPSRNDFQPPAPLQSFYGNSSKLPGLVVLKDHIQGVFLNWYPPKKLKYVKPRLGESTLTQIGLDTPNLAQINFFVLRTFRGGTS